MSNYLESANQILNKIIALYSNIALMMGELKTIEFSDIYLLLIRWVFPVLAVTIFVRCVLPLLRSEPYNTVWGYLQVPDSIKIPLQHWENSIGRSKLSDIVINLPFVSRTHAVLSFSAGTWSVFDLGSKGGVLVNDERIVKSKTVKDGDTISLAGAEFRLLAPEDGPEQQENPAAWFSRFSHHFSSGKTLFMIFLFQFLGGIQIYFSMGQDANPKLLGIFLAFILLEASYFLFMMTYTRKYIELELLAFFLCGINLFVVASAVPDQIAKQLIAIVCGIAVFIALGLLIRDLGRARKLKYVFVFGALVLLVLNLTIGEVRFGAKNWINLGFMSFQPMELIKVAFVMAGTATLDKLLTTRNITAFIGFAGACIGALILMRDLGTAVVFFAAFLVIAFMRSGDLRTIAYACSGAVLGAIAVVSFLPYVASRFEAWGRVWEYANTIGYQQTRTLIAAASGGVLGVGGGNGFLVNIPAAANDLVFGLVCEEWGLIVALITVLIILFFAVLAVSLMRECKSPFYAIAACGAAAIFLVQAALNVFGSVDLLPLTGITLPFVSNGGTSMVTSWALLAFIKAADDRGRPDREGVGD
ncbi:MAG: FtsW/RodA/SpoVE family cell cycle protein [Syntrophomonadaceae bacterium]|nr:FtsW/RodA/SpoVE family cell cycle protein [Syntrophomonadaceae bacterium]